jgi:hypothetical protein
MKKRLSILVSSLALVGWAQTNPVLTYFCFTNAADVTMSDEILKGCTVPHVDWYRDGWGPNANGVTNMFVLGPGSAPAFHQPISVGGVTYDGSEGHAFQMNHTRPYTYFQMSLPNYPQQLQLAGFIMLPDFPPSGNGHYDLASLCTQDGGAVVLQVGTSFHGSALGIECAYAGQSTHVHAYRYPPNTWLWYNVGLDAVNGRAYCRIYDTTNWQEVCCITNTFEIAPKWAKVTGLGCGQGETAKAPGYLTKFANMVIVTNDPALPFGVGRKQPKGK